MSKMPKNIHQIHPGFDTLKKEVLPALELYQDDILVYDKQSLQGYKGRFISAFRSTGTDIFKIDQVDFAAFCKSIDEYCSNDILFLNRNQNFLLVLEDGSSKKISIDQAKALLEEQKRKAFALAKKIEEMNFTQMAFELKWFISLNGRAWKSTLREQWQENRTSPALTRLRNRFDDPILLQFSKESSEEDIRKALVQAYVEGLR